MTGDPPSEELLAILGYRTPEDARGVPWLMPEHPPELYWEVTTTERELVAYYTVINAADEPIWLLDVGGEGLQASEIPVNAPYIRNANTAHHALVFWGAGGELPGCFGPDRHIVARYLAPGEVVDGTLIAPLPLKSTLSTEFKLSLMSDIDGIELELGWLPVSAVPEILDERGYDPAFGQGISYGMQAWLRTDPQPWPLR